MAFRHTLIVTIPEVTRAEEARFKSEAFAQRMRAMQNDELEKPVEQRDEEFEKWREWLIINTDAPLLEQTVRTRFTRVEEGESWQVEEWDGSFRTYDKLPADSDDYREALKVTQSIEDGTVDRVRLYVGDEPSDQTKQKFLRLKPRDQELNRLMVFAHGGTKSLTVGGMEPRALAAFLVKHGLPRDIKIKVSLVACYAAKDMKKTKPVEGSFAHEFHAALKNPYGIESELTARAGEVKVERVGGGYEKVVRGFARKAAGSKYKWSWEDGQQVVNDAYGNRLRVYPNK